MYSIIFNIIFSIIYGFHNLLKYIIIKSTQ